MGWLGSVVVTIAVILFSSSSAVRLQQEYGWMHIILDQCTETASAFRLDSGVLNRTKTHGIAVGSARNPILSYLIARRIEPVGSLHSDIIDMSPLPPLDVAPVSVSPPLPLCSSPLADRLKQPSNPLGYICILEARGGTDKKADGHR